MIGMSGLKVILSMTHFNYFHREHSCLDVQSNGDFSAVKEAIEHLLFRSDRELAECGKSLASYLNKPAIISASSFQHFMAQWDSMCDGLTAELFASSGQYLQPLIDARRLSSNLKLDRSSGSPGLLRTAMILTVARYESLIWNISNAISSDAIGCTTICNAFSPMECTYYSGRKWWEMIIIAGSTAMANVCLYTLISSGLIGYYLRFMLGSGYFQTGAGAEQIWKLT